MSFPVLPQGASDREVVERINRLLQGKLNAVTTVTLLSGATATTLTDSRIGPDTFIGFTPRTATAALAATVLFVLSKTKGSAVLTHDNTADLDRTFDVLLIG